MIWKLHRISAQIAAIPLLFILSTGILLQIKTWCSWIQPPKQIAHINAPSIHLSTLLKSSSSVSEAQVREWKDIRSIDIRPDEGVARVRTRTDYEITIDLEVGRVLQAAPRRTNILIGMHEGSFFGKTAKYGVYLPTAVLLFVLWGTGGLALVRSRWRRAVK
jgi:hypothetical protein